MLNCYNQDCYVFFSRHFYFYNKKKKYQSLYRLQEDKISVEVFHSRYTNKGDSVVSVMFRPPDFSLYRYALGLGLWITLIYKICGVGTRFELKTSSIQGKHSTYYALVIPIKGNT